MLERARQRLAEGRIDEGAECVDRLERLAAQYPAPADCAWSDIHRYAALGRAYVASAEERFDDAILVLTGLPRVGEGTQSPLGAPGGDSSCDR